MRRLFSAVAFLVIVVSPLQAAEPEPQGQVLRDSWYESRTPQGKLGFMHLVARRGQNGDLQGVHTVLQEELKYIRSGDPYSETQEHDTWETESGRVVELGYRSNLSKRQHLVMRGRVQGLELPLRVYSDGQPTKFVQKLAWDNEALGLYASDRIFEGKELKVGDAITIKAFHLSANEVVSMTFTVKGTEPASADGRGPLVRMEQTFPKELYLSKSTMWVDARGLIVKMQEDSPTFGMVTYELTDKEKAAAPFDSKVKDIECPVTVNRPLSLLLGLPKELTIRVTPEEDDDPGTLFPQDGRQTVLKADKKSVELHLLAKVPVPKNAKPNPVPPEYAESNFFIRSEDEVVQKLAKEAVGKEADPRKQTRLIYQWMKGKFDGNYEVPFATADEVARTLEGDCTEMGVLAAAMCRALGIPSRIAFGLVYDVTNPGFGGHLWTEVYLDGQWEPLDTTGVLDLVHAAYIKIADYSMKDVYNPDALPKLRRAFAGRMKVEILK